MTKQNDFFVLGKSSPGMEHEQDKPEMNPKDIPLKMTDRFQVLQEGIRKYYKLMCPLPSSSEVMLQTNNYKSFMSRHPKADAYHYPTEERIFVFFPECLLWGKHPGCSFIVGRDLKGDYLKMRVFNTMHYFAGMHFRHPLFGVRKSRWLVGVTPAKDGAVNLVFAFPLDVSPSSTLRSIPGLSLDERLEILERYKNI